MAYKLIDKLFRERHLSTTEKLISTVSNVDTPQSVPDLLLVRNILRFSSFSPTSVIVYLFQARRFKCGKCNTVQLQEIKPCVYL